MVNWNLHIESNPGRLFGKPTIINTRISVYLIHENLAVGDTKEDILDAYPNLTNDDIIACLLFIADSKKNEIVIPKTS